MEKKTRPLTEQEKEAIWVSLGMRCGYIETGDVTLRAADAKNIYGEDAGRKLKPLSPEQMGVILLSEALVRAVLQDRIILIEEEQDGVSNVFPF